MGSDADGPAAVMSGDVQHDATARPLARRRFRPSCDACGWAGDEAPRFVAERAAKRHNRDADVTTTAGAPELAVVVAMRTSLLPPSATAPTSERAIADCGHEVWLTVESRRLAGELDALVVCLACAPPGALPAVAEPSAEQRATLRAKGMSDADIDEALTIVRTRGVRPANGPA